MLQNTQYGLVTVESVGNQKRYRANASAPIYHELVGIVRKTVGVAMGWSVRDSQGFAMPATKGLRWKAGSTSFTTHPMRSAWRHCAAWATARGTAARASEKCTMRVSARGLVP